MGWQFAVVGLLVTGAVGYLGRAAWRAWEASKKGCGGGCGCASATVCMRAGPYHAESKVVTFVTTNVLADIKTDVKASFFVPART